jgi:hypothetical protein
MSQDTIQYLVLDRCDPTCNMARYYVLSIEPSLFGDATLIREWGCVWTPPGLQGFSVALNENWTCGRVSGLT